MSASTVRFRIEASMELSVDFEEEIKILKARDISAAARKRQMRIIDKARAGRISEARTLYENLAFSLSHGGCSEKEFTGAWFERLIELIDRHAIHEPNRTDGVVIESRKSTVRVLS